MKYDLVLALHSQMFEYLRESFYRLALESWTPAGSQKRRKENGFSLRKRLTVWRILKAHDWSGHIFAASARPRAST